MTMNFDDLYPKPIDVNMDTRKMKFFLNGTWIVVGDIKITSQKAFCMDVTMPDVESFIFDREYLDDGTLDWLEWGPRLN